MSRVRVEPWEDGSSFPVKARAGARRDAVTGVHDGRLKVEVTVAPERGKANEAIAGLLAKSLGVISRSVILLAGGTSQKKRFGVRGMAPAIISARLTALLAEGG